jgi:5-formyltetrahydrofolate cyclo-ligase
MPIFVTAILPTALAFPKADMRRAALTRRDSFVSSLSPNARAFAAAALADRVEAQLDGARNVAVYLPIGSETDTDPIIGKLAARGLAIALPYIERRDTPMRFLLWLPDDPLVSGPMNVRQPDPTAPAVQPDLILAPLLAFDPRLHRLGYGAGCYDRAFAAHPAARRIGLAWHIQQVEMLAEDPWDVPLHGVATETGFIEP